MNVVVVSGNLTRDVEVRYTANGKAVANFTVAINKNRKVGDEWVEDTTFLDCQSWDKLAERLAEVAKGETVLVRGSLREDKWEKDGQKRSKIVLNAEEVQRLSKKRETVGAATGSEQQTSQPAPSQPAPSETEDIPF